MLLASIEFGLPKNLQGLPLGKVLFKDVLRIRIRGIRRPDRHMGRDRHIEMTANPLKGTARAIPVFPDLVKLLPDGSLSLDESEVRLSQQGQLRGPSADQTGLRDFESRLSGRKKRPVLSRNGEFDHGLGRLLGFFEPGDLRIEIEKGGDIFPGLFLGREKFASTDGPAFTVGQNEMSLHEKEEANGEQDAQDGNQEDKSESLFIGTESAVFLENSIGSERVPSFRGRGAALQVCEEYLLSEHFQNPRDEAFFPPAGAPGNGSVEEAEWNECMSPIPE
jgi:hypothetical protein